MIIRVNSLKNTFHNAPFSFSFHFFLNQWCVCYFFPLNVPLQNLWKGENPAWYYLITFSVCICNLVPLLLKLEMQTDEGLVKCCWEQNCTSRGRALGCYALPILCFISDWWRPLTAQSRWWEGREADHLEVITWSFPDSRHCAKHTFQALQMQCPFLNWVSFHSLESLNTVSQIFFIYTLYISVNHFWSILTFNLKLPLVVKPGNTYPCMRTFIGQYNTIWRVCY